MKRPRTDEEDGEKARQRPPRGKSILDEIATTRSEFETKIIRLVDIIKEIEAAQNVQKSKLDVVAFPQITEINKKSRLRIAPICSQILILSLKIFRKSKLKLQNQNLF